MRYYLQSDHDVAWIVFFFFYYHFSLLQFNISGIPLCAGTSINFLSLPFIYITRDKVFVREEEGEKKKRKCTSQSAACKFPEPEKIFQSDESPRRLTNCERPRCDRWISGLPGRPPHPSRTLAQPPIFSDSRKTAEIITTPFNWRIKMRQ